jgi:hypothetical protein
VRVEHAIAGVKISRTAKDQVRNTADGPSDAMIAIACGWQVYVSHAALDDIEVHHILD